MYIKNINKSEKLDISLKKQLEVIMTVIIN